METQSIGPSSISEVGLSTNMSCPSPIQLPHNLGVIEWTMACDLASMIRPIVLVFAWLAACLIVIGGLKGT